MTRIVNCSICGRRLPIDFFECDACGFKNPQLHMVKREVIHLGFHPSLFRAIKLLSISRGVSIERFLNEAAEFYISEINKGNR